MVLWHLYTTCTCNYGTMTVIYYMYMFEVHVHVLYIILIDFVTIHYYDTSIVFIKLWFIMTCTLYTCTSQYRSRSNETSTCKYYIAEKTNQHWGK